MVILGGEDDVGMGGAELPAAMKKLLYSFAMAAGFVNFFPRTRRVGYSLGLSGLDRDSMSFQAVLDLLSEFH